jgi:hypothetical protein
MLVPVTSRYSESVASLHDALITQGVAPDDLAALMAWPPYRGLGLAERVYRSGLVSDARLVEALVSLGATDATPLVLAATPPPAALGAFTRALAQRHRALPLSIERRRLVVALLDPGDAATLEKLSHVCGLAIEPRACRPRVLFERLARAYDAVVVKPEPGFLHSRRAALVAAAADADDVGRDLPPPSTDAALQVFVRRGHVNVSTSPMARALAEVADMVGAQDAIEIDLSDDDDDNAHRRLPADGPHDLRPASSPSLSQAAIAELRAGHTDVVAARDSLPPMVLRLLVPPLRSCALFVIRSNIAVGWDVRTANGAISTATMRDVLVPLTADSVLATAYQQRHVAVGRARDPTTMERTLFRLMRLAPPRSFIAVPVLVGATVEALMYADSGDAVIDDALIDELRRVGSALGDALAPLLAAGMLAPPARPGGQTSDPDSHQRRAADR